jgi:hypothetical protein
MRHIVAAIVVGLALTGCSKPTASDVGTREPAFKLTAEEFHRQAGDEKFDGKVIELSGTVEGVGRNAGGEAFVQLKVPSQMFGVMCFTTDEQPWAKVARGQKVRIKGLGGAVILAPRLLACAIVEPGEYAAVRISAADLAKEYAADPDATIKKYDKKHMVVTGEVAAKDVNEFKAVGLTLKTGNKVAVKCGFTAFDRDVSRAYAVGQTVSVFGEFSLNFGGGDSVDINFCLPLDGP